MKRLFGHFHDVVHVSQKVNWLRPLPSSLFSIDGVVVIDMRVSVRYLVLKRILSPAVHVGIIQPLNTPTDIWINHMVHIEDLFTAFQKFNSRAINIRSSSLRNPKEWEEQMEEARLEFKKFCDDNNIPVDFSNRD